MILGSIGLSMLVVGTALAVGAERCVGRSAELEYVAGTLLLVGLSLIGIGLARTLPSVPFASP